MLPVRAVGPIVTLLVSVAAPASAQPVPALQLERECQSGRAEACLALSTRQRGAAAARTRTRACQLGSAEACAIEILAPRPVDRARFASLRGLCDRGNQHACAWVGLLLHAGEATERDSRAAVPLLERACRAEVSLACHQLGQIYGDGYSPRAVAADPNVARRWYAGALRLGRRGCEAGDARACSDVAQQYWQGQGVARDDAQRWAHERRACELGEASACHTIGHGHWEGAPGIPIDFERAAPMLLRACDLGDEWTCRGAPQILVDQVVVHPAVRWTDQATLAALLAIAERQLAPSPSPRTHAAIGAAHLLAGRAQPARASFEAGLRLAADRHESTRAPYVLGLALVLDALGRSADARNEYSRFVALAAGSSLEPYLILPRGQGIRPDAALAHARARISALERH